MLHFISLPLISAYAILFYLDPGNGSLIIQLILGALLAIGLSVRIFWSKIKGRFGHNRSDVVEPQAAETDKDKINDSQ
jgi:hypothetical protein